MKTGKTTITTEEVWRRAFLGLQGATSVLNRQQSMLEDVKKIEVVKIGNELSHVKITLRDEAKLAVSKTTIEEIKKYLIQKTDFKIELS